MLLIAVRTLIMYALVLLAIRIMGKSELSKMSPFQMVITFMIAELAAIPIDNPSVSVIHGIIGVLTLTFLQIILSLLSIKSEGFKNLISGKPSILIEKGKLNIKEMRKLRITITDLPVHLQCTVCNHGIQRAAYRNSQSGHPSCDGKRYASGGNAGSIAGHPGFRRYRIPEESVAIRPDRGGLPAPAVCKRVSVL